MKIVKLAILFAAFLTFPLFSTSDVQNARLFGDESVQATPDDSQPAAPWNADSWQSRKQEFFLSTLEKSDQENFAKSPEEWRREYASGVWKAAARLFEPRGTESEPREYAPEERELIGEKGRLSEAQVAALKTFVAPYLEIPRRALTDDEKTAVADAFSLSKDRLDFMARAFESFLRDSYGDDPVRTSCVLFGVKITDSLMNASYDDLQSSIAALLEERSALQFLDEIQKQPRVERGILLDCLLERLGDRLSDYEYAHALNDSIDNLLSLNNETARRRDEAKDGALAYLLVEARLEKATAARPQSWEVACVVAGTIWRRLPKTFKPSAKPEGAPLRANCAVPAKRDQNSGDVIYIDGPPMTFPETTLFSEDRDRVVVLQTLSRALPNALASGGETPKEVRVARQELPPAFPQRSADPVLFSGFFNLLAEATRTDRTNGREVDLNQKTDLTSLPPLLSFDEWNDRKRDKEPRPRYEYELPDSFEDAANDGERLEYAKLLEGVATPQGDVVDSPASFFARLGIALQNRLGVYEALYRAFNARRNLARVANRDAEGNWDDDVREEIARLDRLVAEIPALKDDETFVFSEQDFRAALKDVGRNVDSNLAIAKSVCPKRRVLSKNCDFVAYLKRSLELEENADALVALAAEYQLRRRYKEAIELWDRVKSTNSYSQERITRLFGTTGPTETLQIEALQNATTVKIVDEGSESKGMRVSLDVFSQGAKAIKTTFYQLDLAPFVAKTLEKDYYDARNENNARTEKSFVNFVAEVTRELFAQEKPISSLAREVQSSTFVLPGKEEQTSVPTLVPLTFTLDKPGAYLVKVADADGEDRADYALAFVSRYAFAYQFGRLVVSDFQTGKPLANRELSLLYVGSVINSQNKVEAKAEAATVKTDERGIVQLDANLNSIHRVMAFVQDDDSEENDRSISFFDSLDSPYSAASQANASALPSRDSSPKLILATNRPIYAPGETVDFVAQIAPQWNGNNDPRVRVFKILNLPPQIVDGASVPQTCEIANFPVFVDENGSFSESFTIPQDAEPGKYVFQIGYVAGLSGTREPRFMGVASSTLYVSTRNDDATTSGADATTPAPSSDSSAETTTAPMIVLDFDKPNYSLDADKTATVVIRSSIPDASVVLDRIKEVRRDDGRIESKSFDARRVELRDGVGECQFDLDKQDAPCFTLIANVAFDGKAQTFSYLVGAQKQSFARDALLDAPTKVKPGEKVVLSAKFKPLNDDDALFAGRASLAVYDAKLDLTPVDDFSSYFSSLQVATRLLERQDYAPTKMTSPIPSRPRSDRAHALNRLNSIYEDFVDFYPSPSVELTPRRYIQMQKEFDSRPRQTPVGADANAVPTIPASASSDSILKTTAVKNRVDALSFKFDAPQTPGTYRMVFRAFDAEKGVATFVKRDLIVE